MMIFLIIVGSLAAIAALLLFLPIFLRIEFAVSETARSGKVRLYWGHPSVAGLTYEVGAKDFAVKIFGWHPRRSASGESAEESAAASSSIEKSPFVEDEKSPFAKDTTEAELKSAPPVEAPPQPAAPERAVPAAAVEPKRESADRKAPGRPPEREPEPKRAQESSWKKFKRIFTALNHRPWRKRLFRWAFRVLRSLFRLIRIDHVRLHAKAGMEDPADTGKLYGRLIGLKAGLFSHVKRADLRLEPCFSGPLFEVNGAIGISTSLYRLLAPFGLALTTFPYYKSWVVWRRFKAAQKPVQPAPGNP
jgi:hypothetical protein